MTREQFVERCLELHAEIQKLYSEAYTLGIIGPDARSQMRGSMYGILGVAQEVKRDGQLEKLVESAEK